ncbi:RVP_2 domain-containing protein [Cephalotus follicularis]|uniref:RVP_2 domain-containing protein n=1 Tax=Cephalotus follicularis TaxID=3775 RepID=A0A1Q3BBP8_CEPFO|nr:RVP_2 domain-containing protein [Cephalotus follicularis]
MQANNLIKNWVQFLGALQLRFGPSEFDDPRGKQAKLYQRSTVADFQNHFQELSNKAPSISEDFLVSLFISGLKPKLMRELLVAQPSTLLQTMAMAKLYEEKYMHFQSSFKNSWGKTSTTAPAISGVKFAHSPSAPTIQVSSSLIPVKQLTPAELKVRRDKGLCYNCDDKFRPGHKCKSKFFLLLVNDEEVEDGEVEGNDTEICCEELEVDQFPEVSMLAFDGKHTPKTIRLQGMYQSHILQVLIDNDSTHNFIQERLVSNLGISKMDIKPFHVFVGNGEVLTCSSKCLNIPIKIQGHEFRFDLYILPIQGVEVVLGIEWLELLGPVITDYKHLTMKF